jgi:hypothetical protein
MVISSRVADRIDRDFDDRDRVSISPDLRALDLGKSSEERDEMICAAVSIMAAGDLVRFGSALALAERDWRDVLMSAGLTQEDWRARLDEARGPTLPAGPAEETR